MKTLATLILVTILTLAPLPASQAQEQTPPEPKMECNTSPRFEQLKAEIARQRRYDTQQMAAATTGFYHLPMSIHIVRRSDGTGGLTISDLEAAMRDMNQLWQQVGIQFFIYGDIDYINSDTHFNVPNMKARQDALRQVNPVASTINVYFTNLAGLCGQSSFTTDSFQGILIDIGCAGVVSNPTGFNPSTFAHEVGHYFDLFHTHETWPDNMGNPTRVECPSGSNCSTAGDLLCDTPADPNLSNNVDATCGWTGSATTPGGCASAAYNPPTRNLMSYSRATCRTDFTASQVSKILQVLRDNASRRNLIITGARYVDPVASQSNGDCSYNFPCHTISKAIQLALPGDHIFIRPGTNLATLLPGGKQVFLERWGTDGIVRITP
ncbi:MAG: M43 family zinc metalloprotease [Blastocatellia bacterium]